MNSLERSFISVAFVSSSTTMVTGTEAIQHRNILSSDHSKSGDTGATRGRRGRAHRTLKPKLIHTLLFQGIVAAWPRVRAFIL